jgi:peptide chain release factor 2
VIHFDISKIQLEIKELQTKVNEPNFWNNPALSTPIITKLKRLENEVETYKKLEQELDNINEMTILLINEPDEQLELEVVKSTKKLEKEINELEVKTLLSGKYDQNNAILTLHPGAGGTESQDWVQMLYRMYSKWASNNNYAVKELDYLEGDEAGIKSVTFLISGEYAYGYLKGEMGVHRLVRISPFDSGGRRHTSFASLEVLPEISEDIVLDINPDDLRIDTYRASRSRRSTHK